MNVAIVKYNAGNIYSVVNALKRLGLEPLLTDDAEQLQKADRVLFPGQGEARGAMEYLKARRLGNRRDVAAIVLFGKAAGCVFAYAARRIFVGVVFDGKTRTATITADQRAMRYSVKFYYNNDIYDVERVQLNSQVMPNGRYVQAPNTDSSGKPFAYWFVEENGREVAKCYDRNFNLRITGDSIVTACYGETAKSVTISNAEYSREQYTDPKTNKPVDKLYADFIAAYMDKQGTMLNPAYTATPNVATPYQTGLIIQYSQNQKVTKPDEPGAKLAEGDKKVFPQSDVLTKENAKLIAEGKTLNNGYTYHVAAISNSKYNNRNRINKPLSFNNTESARHLVLCAYYYVLNTKTNDFEMSEPVYFYLYDIGNSVVEK